MTELYKSVRFADYHSLYVCGPTIYRRAHLGNLRNYVIADVFRRVYNLQLAIGLTDISDQIVETYSQGRSYEINQFRALFVKDLLKLNVTNYQLLPVTEHIPQILAVIEQLVVTNNIVETDSELRLTINEEIHFAVWKKIEMLAPLTYPSKWGRGRPGWHIECVANVLSLKGPVLHSGGIDSSNYHHKLEQKVFQALKYHVTWLKNQLITVNGEKMSKSLKNYILLEQFLVPSLARYFFLTADYTKILEYTEVIVIQKIKELERVLSKVYEILLYTPLTLSGVILKSNLLNLELTGTHLRKLYSCYHELTHNKASTHEFLELFVTLNHYYQFIDLDEVRVANHLRELRNYNKLKKTAAYTESDKIRKNLQNEGIQLVFDNRYKEYLPFIKLKRYEEARIT